MKILKNNFFLGALISLVCLSACDVVHFNRIPGTAQDTIPAEFRGEYMLAIKKKEKSNLDTLTFYVGKNSYTRIDKNEVEIKFLSDSLMFSRYGDFYFLSEKQLGMWTTNVLKLKGKDLYVFLVEVNGSSSSDKLKTLKKYFNNARVEVNGTQEIFAADMNEEKMLKYVSKNLKHKGVKLNRIE